MNEDRMFLSAILLFIFSSLTSLVILVLVLVGKLLLSLKSRNQLELDTHHLAVDSQRSLLEDVDAEEHDTFQIDQPFQKLESSDHLVQSNSTYFHRNLTQEMCSAPLPPIKGPTGVSITYHVYTPPLLDREIPKMDIVGAIQFVKTGNVRTFVHAGVKRLLVINFQDMTLELFLPKHCGGNHKKLSTLPGELATVKSMSSTQDQSSFSKETSHRDNERKRLNGINNRSSNISFNLQRQADSNSLYDDDENDKSWEVENFEPSPTTVINLYDLVSVSAKPPQYSGVIEVSYRIPTVIRQAASPSKRRINRKRSTIRSSYFEQISKRNLKKSITRDRNRLGRLKSKDFVEVNVDRLDFLESSVDLDKDVSLIEPTASIDVTCTQQIHKTSNNSNGIGRGFAASPRLGAFESNVDHKISQGADTFCKNEFAFFNPRDAAEFQQVIMALRTSGKEIFHLYEMLEEIHANSEAHFPLFEHPSLIERNKTEKKNLQCSDKTKHMFLPSFAPPGVALDDAWRCMNEITIVRKGLTQYHRYTDKKRGGDDDMIAAAAESSRVTTDHIQSDSYLIPDNKNMKNQNMNNRKKASQFYCERRILLGIVDFFFLFVPPPPLDSSSLPYSTPCAASQFTLKDCSHDEIFTGVELHYQRLYIALTLQQLVRRAALYVLAYHSAKMIAHEGWRLKPTETEAYKETTENTHMIQDECTETFQCEGEKADYCYEYNCLNRLAFDCDRENWIHDTEAHNECYEATVGKDITVMVNSAESHLEPVCLIESPYQGFTLVGYNTFKTEFDETSLQDTSKRHSSLNPFVDPLECIHSLRKVIVNNPESQFLVISYFNECTSVAGYLLFVRSLPTGIDEAFDDTFRAFINSSSEDRDKRVELSFQVAFINTWSTLTNAIVRTFVMVMCFCWLKAYVPPPLTRKGKRVRMSFPGMFANDISKVRHFGGSLQTKDDFPKNYVAITLQLGHLKGYKNLIARILLPNLSTLIEKNVVDIIFLLKTLQSDKNRNQKCVRALATIRLVRIHENSIATPVYYQNESSPVGNVAMEEKEESKFDPYDSSEERSHKQENADIVCEELYKSEIDAIDEILDGVTLPRRSYKIIDGKTEIITKHELVRLNFSRADIQRYLHASGCDLKAAVIRIVESCVWRGVVFPIDTFACRVELQSGQFFHQGYDKENNSIFYFRKMLLGLWRNDVSASINAILHRLESYFISSSALKPRVKITLVVLLGSPQKKGAINSDTENNITINQRGSYSCDFDPKIDPTSQEFTTHCSTEMLTRLIDIFIRHYPERLARVLVVASEGWSKSRIRDYLPAQVMIQSDLVIMNSMQELKKYIDDDQLVSIAGGKASISIDAFSS